MCNRYRRLSVEDCMLAIAREHALFVELACMRSYRPDGGLAAASTEVLDLSMVVMPAFATEMVCCSMACMQVLGVNAATSA